MSTENPDILDEADTKNEIHKLLLELKSVSPETYEFGRKLVETYEEQRPLTEEELKKALTLLKPKPKQGKFKLPSLDSILKTVKVLTVIESKTFGAHEEILKLINVQEHSTDYEWVLVFCPVISRVLIDVDTALANIPEEAKQKKTVLVLMYYTRDVTFSTATEMHPDVKFSVDVLFHDTGFLDCDKNKQAIKELKKILQSKRMIW